MQLCRGGELFDRIIARKKFSEEEARCTVASLLSAIDYLHAHGVVHRDLKPENLLLVGADSDEVVVTDFGLSKFNSDEDVTMSTICGSPSYIAPEVLAMQGYGKECDLWSVGVVTYILLCGYPPFHAADNLQLFQKIRLGQWAFHSPWWDAVSDGAKDLVRSLLVLNPAHRLTAPAALAHPWLHCTANAAPAGTDLVAELATHMQANLGFRRAVKSTRALVRIKLAVMRAFQSVGSADPSAHADADADGDETDDERVQPSAREGWPDGGARTDGGRKRPLHGSDGAVAATEESTVRTDGTRVSHDSLHRQGVDADASVGATVVEPGGEPRRARRRSAAS